MLYLIKRLHLSSARGGSRLCQLRCPLIFAASSKLCRIVNCPTSTSEIIVFELASPCFTYFPACSGTKWQPNGLMSVSEDANPLNFLCIFHECGIGPMVDGYGLFVFSPVCNLCFVQMAIVVFSSISGSWHFCLMSSTCRRWLTLAPLLDQYLRQFWPLQSSRETNYYHFRRLHGLPNILIETHGALAVFPFLRGVLKRDCVSTLQEQQLTKHFSFTGKVNIVVLAHIAVQSNLGFGRCNRESLTCRV